MNDSVEIPTKQFLIQPYILLARQSISSIVSDGDAQENEAFTRRINTFAVVCGLQGYREAELNSQVVITPSFTDVIQKAMNGLTEAEFPQEKKGTMSKLVAELSSKPKWTALELHNLLFGLIEDTIAGELETALINKISTNQEKKAALAMVSFGS